MLDAGEVRRAIAERGQAYVSEATGFDGGDEFTSEAQAREAMVDRVAELMHQGLQGGRAIFGPDGSGGAFYTEDSCPPLREDDVVVTVPYRRGKRPTRWWAGLAVNEALGHGEAEEEA